MCALTLVLSMYRNENETANSLTCRVAINIDVISLIIMFVVCLDSCCSCLYQSVSELFRNAALCFRNCSKLELSRFKLLRCRPTDLIHDFCLIFFPASLYLFTSS